MSASARGIILAREGEQLVIQATAVDVARFGVGDTVRALGFDAPPALGWNNVYADMMADGYLYDKTGRRVAVLEQINAEVSAIDVTTFADTGTQYLTRNAGYILRGRGPV